MYTIKRLGSAGCVAPQFDATCNISLIKAFQKNAFATKSGRNSRIPTHLPGFLQSIPKDSHRIWTECKVEHKRDKWFCRILRTMLGMNFPGLQCQDEKWTCLTNREKWFERNFEKFVPDWMSIFCGFLPIQPLSVSHKMVVKELKHSGYNTGLETNHFTLVCSRFKPYGYLLPWGRKQKKLHTGIDVFFRSFGITVLKKTDQEIGFLVIPFQTDRFSFCASKFEDAICWLLIQQFQKEANQQLRVAFMVSHCFWHFRLYSCFEV